MEPAVRAGRPPKPEDRTPSDDLPDGAPEGLQRAADGEEDLAPEERGSEAEHDTAEGQAEVGALDFLLGDTPPIKYDVNVVIDVPGGKTAELTFVIRQVDGKRILGLEDEHTTGIGPFARLDDVPFNAALVAEGTIEIIDKKTGRKVTPDDQEWIGDHQTPALAMEHRFSYSAGVLSGLAGQIRSVSGWAPGRVGNAERPIRDAVRSS